MQKMFLDMNMKPPSPQTDTIDTAFVAKTEEPDVVKQMDMDEVLRLDTMILKEQLERETLRAENYRKKLAEKEINEAKINLQDYLYDKHKMSNLTHKIVIDSKNGTITFAKIK